MKFLGIYPFTVKNNKWISRILTTLLMGLYMSNTTWVSINLTFFAPFELNIFEKHLEMAAFLTPCLIYGRLVYVHVSKSEQWKTIFTFLSDFDSVSYKNKGHHESMVYGILKIALLNVVFLLTPAVTTAMWVPTDPLTPLENNIKTGIANQLSFLYQFNLGGFLWELSCCLGSRYSHVHGRIQTIMVKKKFMNDDELDKELQVIMHLYKMLYFCTENLSNIFGVTILFCLVHFTAFQLENIYWAIVMCKNGEYPEYIYIQFIYLSSFMVS